MSLEAGRIRPRRGFSIEHFPAGSSGCFPAYALIPRVERFPAAERPSSDQLRGRVFRNTSRRPDRRAFAYPKSPDGTIKESVHGQLF
jgi:hypothetical protein